MYFCYWKKSSYYQESRLLKAMSISVGLLQNYDNMANSYGYKNETCWENEFQTGTFMDDLGWQMFLEIVYFKITFPTNHETLGKTWEVFYLCA